MGRWRILVVDDEPMNREIIGGILDDPDFLVESAADGEIAWQAMQAAAQPPHLVVLDRMMPVMDGMELLRRIKGDAGFANIPVIMQSVAGSPSDIAEGVAAGAWYYLPKPYTPRELLTIVRAALDEVAERELANLAVRNRRGVLEMLSVAEFEFRTLKEAGELAMTLASLCPDPAAAALGLSELMVNAVEHGNLGIGYHEKSELRREGTWEKAVEARLDDPVLGARRARVAFQRQPGRLSFTISDEGEGFDATGYLDFAPERAFDPNGRGIALARQCGFSEIEYLGKGSVVVATLRPPGKRD